MLGLAIALAGGYGVFLVYTAIAYGWRGMRVAGDPVRGDGATSRRARVRDALVRGGLGDVSIREVGAVTAVLFTAAFALAYAMFGGALPALAAGAFAATAPVASYRARRERRLAEAREAWPRIIEEIRLLTGSLGRSVPQALLEAGRRAPEELRSAFAAAEREWLLTTDFGRTCAVLKHRLADPTADATCETLLVAHQVGGTDVDRRLAALVEDRLQDLHGRKDARAKQAGVRFARRFVLVVPLGMAAAGLSIGTGRAAYQTPLGQVFVAAGVGVVALCWAWAGRLLRLPIEERVFR